MMYFQKLSRSIYWIYILPIIVLFGWISPIISVAKTYEVANVKTTKVVDGDTFHANLPEVGNQTIRIWSIDSPEKKQRCGPQATEFLASLIWDKPLKLKVKAKDQYGRLVAQVFHEGVDIGLVMVRYGFAWHYAAISKDKSLIQAQADAKKQKLGLWSDANPTAPWVFRKIPKAQ